MSKLSYDNNKLVHMINGLDLKMEEYCDNIINVCEWGGVTEDADVMLEEAKEGIIQRAIEFVRKIKNEIISFIKNIINTVREKFFSAKSKEKFDKIDDIINSNPKIKGKKIKVNDVNKINKASGETLSEIDGVENKLVSGSISGEQAIKELNMIKEKHKKRMKIAKTAFIAISLGSVLMFVKKNVKSVSNSSNSSGVKKINNGETTVRKAASTAERKLEKLSVKGTSNKDFKKWVARHSEKSHTPFNIKAKINIKNIQTVKAKEVSESVTAAQKITSQRADVVRENLTENINSANSSIGRLQKEILKLEKANTQLLNTMNTQIDKSVEKMKQGNYFTSEEDRLINKIDEKIKSNDEKIRENVRMISGGDGGYYTPRAKRQELAINKALAYKNKSDYDMDIRNSRDAVRSDEKDIKFIKPIVAKNREKGDNKWADKLEEKIKYDDKRMKKEYNYLRNHKNDAQKLNKEYNIRRKELLKESIDDIINSLYLEIYS